MALPTSRRFAQLTVDDLAPPYSSKRVVQKPLSVLVLHGYGLSGSGSEVYVARMSEQLVEAGVEVHVVCQERSVPPDHIGSIYDYGPAGEVVSIEHLSDAGATMHRPFLGPILPVYAWGEYPGFDDVRVFPDLTSQELEDYIEWTRAAVERIVRYCRVDVIHAQHVVAMPEVARRVRAVTGCPYVVTPHGSAIEYVVRRDDRFHRLAAAGLRGASRAVIGGGEMSARLASVFGDACMEDVPVDVVSIGVDPDMFRPRGTAVPDRPQLSVPCGQGACRALGDALYNEACGGDDPRLQRSVEAARIRYEHRAADRDLPDTLDAIAWGEVPVIGFGGKLVPGKGLHVLLASMIDVLEVHPQAHLVIAGEGPFREPLMLLLRAMARGNHELFRQLVDGGRRLCGDPGGALVRLLPEVLPGRFATLACRARNVDLESHVHFVGFVPHRDLALLMATVDVIVLPSVVPEAYPLAAIEALAVGNVPVATDHGGTKGFFDEIASRLPSNLPGTRVDPSVDGMRESLGQRLCRWIERMPGPIGEARLVAEERFAWKAVASRMQDVLRDVCATRDP